MKRGTMLAHAQAVSEGWMDIGQAADAAGVSAKMVRHYEQIGLLADVARTEANYRIYSSNDVHRLRFIGRGRALGFSIEEIRDLLALWDDASRPSRQVKRIALEHVQDLKQRIAQMQAMVETLEDLASHCRGNERPECPILGKLAAPAQRVARDHPADGRALSAGKKKAASRTLNATLSQDV